MILVGVDIAKQTHFAAAQRPDGDIVFPVFEFSNDIEGFGLLLSKLKPFSKSEILIGLESTAHYADNLVFFLSEKGYALAVINPLQTASLRNTGIRKAKTDRIDPWLIIKSLIVNSFSIYSAADTDILTLKRLCRFRQNLKKSKARLKTQLVAYLDVLFPELQYFFKSGIHINSCYQLLKVHSNPDDIAALHLTFLSNLLRKASRGRFSKEDAVRLKSLAKSSVGIKDANLSIQVAQTLSQIELIEKQICELEPVITSIMLSLDSVIMSIPGIGFMNGAMILGEIGSINRFSSSDKLLAFAGLDPGVSQSGKFTAKKTRMSKRGSKLLRYALVNAAWNASLNDITFKSYYDSKRAQGKNHYNALGHTAHKLVRVIFKLLKGNITFDSQTGAPGPRI
jgi:transposase